MSENIHTQLKTDGGVGAGGSSEGDISVQGNQDNGDISNPSNRVDVYQNNACPDSIVDHMNALMPTEIWGMILDLVGDTQSVHNTFLVYPPFRDAFKDKMQLWYFGQVFECVLPYLTKQDVRRCSHVCTTWRDIIHQFMEDHLFRRAYDEDQPNTVMDTPPFSSSTTRQDFIVDFKNIGLIKRFLSIDPNHTNPFIGRSVSLHDLSFKGSMVGQELDHLQANSSQLLEKYGKEIWHIKISRLPSSSEVEEPNEFYNQLTLEETLIHLPNLRSLHVVVNRDTKLNIRTFWPLPLLRNLESLTLEWDCSTGPIFTALLRSYSTKNLSFLSLHADRWKELERLHSQIHDGWLINSNIYLKNLTEVKISNGVTSHVKRFLAKLSKFKLQKMDFDGYIEKDPKRFFKNLNGFEIRVLYLNASPMSLETDCTRNCRSAGSCKMWKRVIINLPKLHTLRIRHQQGHSYKFLGKLPSLQNLEIWSESWRSGGSVQWISVEERTLNALLRNRSLDCTFDEITRELYMWLYEEPTLDKSIIWDLLPELKTLKIHTGRECIYRRKDYI